MQQRGHIITEKRNPRSTNLDELSVAGILEVINAEDAGIAGAVRAVLPQIADFVELVIQRFHAGGRLIYAGAGTSGRLGVLDASECPPTFSSPIGMVHGVIAGGQDALTRSIEGAEDLPETGADAMRDINLSAKDCLLGIATGATTPYVQGALQYARKVGAATGYMICTDPAEFADLADIIIPVIVGPEVVTGSTRMKAGTATKLVLNMISTTAMVRLNKTYGNLMVDLKALNVKLWDRGSRILTELTSLDYDQSFALLKSADGEVKTALVMELTGRTKAAASQALAAADGNLRQVIESAPK